MEDEIRDVLQFWSCKSLGGSIPECNFENVIHSIMAIVQRHSGAEQQLQPDNTASPVAG